MRKGVIFDLDQTLVDSSIAEQHRRNRNWPLVYRLIPSFVLYNGIKEVFTYMNDNKIRSCVVTSSPKNYAKKVVEYFGVPCEFIIDFFSTSQIKPHPAPMLKALELFNLSNHEVISFGDRAVDIESAKSANIKSVACIWGTREEKALISALPDVIIRSPIEIAHEIGYH